MSWIARTAAFCVGLLAAHRAFAAPGPCERLREACQEAGFIQGGAARGIGLQVDCIAPLVQGQAQRAQSAKPLPQVSAEIVAACRVSMTTPATAPAATAPAAAAPSAVLSRPAPADRLVTGQSGDQLYVSAATGVAHLMMKLPAPLQNGTLTAALASLGSSCPLASVTAPKDLPPRWDLHGAFPGYGADLMTPVEDQLARGSCWAFAQVAQLEMEYVATYAKSHTAEETKRYAKGLRLSEQYYLDMTALMTTGPVYSEWASAPPPPIPAGTYAWPIVAVADPTALNATCGGTPLLGLPSFAGWPYADRDATKIYPMMKSTPIAKSLAATDSAGYWNAFPPGAPPLAYADKWTNGLSYGFNLDLANFYWSNLPPPKSLPQGWSGLGDPKTSPLAPPAVHEAARYAPLAIRFLSVYFAADTGSTAKKPAETLPAGCKKKDGAPAQHLSDYPIVNSSMTPSSNQIDCYEKIAAPYETLLSQNHPIVVTTRPINWGYDTFLLQKSDIPSYWDANNPAWSGTSVLTFANHPADSSSMQTTYPLRDEQDVDQHFVLLIGYDRDKQLFHFKNSWGTSAGTGQGMSGTGAADGTFWMTYDLLFRTLVTLPEYIDGVWDPSGALMNRPGFSGGWFR